MDIISIELIATISGMISVWFASQTNQLTWIFGLISQMFLFILFYKIQLYGDMILQIYFTLSTIYGYYMWKELNKITLLSNTNRIYIGIIIIIGTLSTGFFFNNIHLYFPTYFPPTDYGLINAFTMVLSMCAMVLMAQQKLESWYLWIIIDVISTIVYFKNAVYFLSIEYLIFLIIAIYGYYNWKRQIN